MANHKRDKEFFHNHIRELSEKLDGIYSIKEAGKQVNVCEELRVLEMLESVYSVIESKGIPDGETYLKYSNYLSNVRQRKQNMIAKKAEIEEVHATEIQNIKLLLSTMETHLEASCAADPRNPYPW